MKKINATLICTALCAPAVGAPATGSLTTGIGNLELGAPSAKFGEYSGLGDDAVLFLGKLNLDWREQAHYLNVDAADIGNDTLHMGLRGGVSQVLRIDLTYDQIPHLISHNARSPYGGVRSASLTLPAGFVPPSPETLYRKPNYFYERKGFLRDETRSMINPFDAGESQFRARYG